MYIVLGGGEGDPGELLGGLGRVVVGPVEPLVPVGCLLFVIKLKFIFNFDPPLGDGQEN